MKKIIFSFFLVSCASTQIMEKQMEEQRKQISFLQQVKEEQEKTLRKMFVRLRKNKKESTVERHPIVPLIITKTLCIEDGEEETCIDFMVEK